MKNFKMGKEVFILTMLSLLSQVWTDSWPDSDESEEFYKSQKSEKWENPPEPQEPQESQESQKSQKSQEALVPPANMLLKNRTNTQLPQQINESMTFIFQNMASYELYARNITDQVLDEHRITLEKHISAFKSNLKLNTDRKKFLQLNKNAIQGRTLECLVEETKLDDLFKKINDQIKKCGAVAVAELENVFSNSANEAQVFMSIWKLIGRDIERCELSSTCRWAIARDAIAESIQVPPKVFALATKIQSIALKTIVSVDSCGLESLRQVTETGLGILDRIFACIDETKSDEHDDDL